ncbi:hypothetical protein ABT158_18835 [Nonomuraea sp. NPDC001636]|uniref:hypothetical protein n=1 Tax=Nonomuraea sp. NPDC001636 TaxID=3154391 RepID=UPI003316A97B
MTTTETVSFDLHVSYRQAYLIDVDTMVPEAFPDDHPERPVGILRVKDDKALLVTGLHTGIVGSTVTVAYHDPGADTDGYEDIVEISFRSETGRLWLCEWAGERVHELPELPSGPGWYRLRHHAANMDEGAEVNTSLDVVVDRYLLHIWPQAASAPSVVKSTSQQLAYWRSAG